MFWRVGLICLMLSSGGCGQKGELYYPAEELPPSSETIQ